MGKYIIAIVAIVVVLVGIMAFVQNQESAPVSNTTGNTTSQIDGPTPTGNVDDVVAAIMKDAENDAIPAAETDATLAAENDQAVGDFGKAFDATVF